MQKGEPVAILLFLFLSSVYLKVVLDLLAAVRKELVRALCVCVCVIEKNDMLLLSIDADLIHLLS